MRRSLLLLVVVAVVLGAVGLRMPVRAEDAASGSETPSPTASPTVTATPTLAARVLVITAVYAGVTLDAPTAPFSPTATPTPFATVDVPLPPPVMPPAAEAAATAGWRRFEDDDPAIAYSGHWEAYRRSQRGTAGRYMYTADSAAVAALRFLGSGVRVRYVAFHLFGLFEIRIDGQTMATLDGYHPRQRDGFGAFLSTEVFKLHHDWHTLEVLNTGRRHPDSGGVMMALDAIEVYRAAGEPTPLPTAMPAATLTLTPSLAPARRVELVSAPPGVRATATPSAPTVIGVSLVIAYDENGNRVVDAAEGVRGIPVRLLEASTNQVVASGLTSVEGYVRLEAVSNAPLRLVVPYFGRAWDVSASRGADARFTLLIPPANQPGLIP